MGIWNHPIINLKEFDDPESLYKQDSVLVNREALIYLPIYVTFFTDTCSPFY